jgi:hypothetical protein
MGHSAVGVVWISTSAAKWKLDAVARGLPGLREKLLSRNENEARVFVESTQITQY